MGNLRIITKNSNSLRFGDISPEEGGSNYTSRMVKLIPSEALALYLIGNNLIPKDNILALGIFSLVCLILVLLTRIQLTKDKNNSSPQWGAVIISLITFIIWIYASGGFFIQLEMHEPWLGTLLLTTWIFIIPYFYKGDRET